MNRPPSTPSSADSLIGRLVPFIDGELSDEDRAAVEAELARDPELRAMVEEQVEVRGLLRGLPRGSAPAGLSARVRLDLDAVDREEAMQASPTPRGRWPRLVALARGGMVMIPAAAAAALLFVVTRFTAVDAAPTEAPTVAISAPTAATPTPFATGGGPVIVGAAPRGDADGVSLVGLADLNAEDPSFPEIAEYTVNDRGTRVVDLRRPASASPLPGVTLSFRGHRYYAARDRRGRVTIAFTVGDRTHVLVPASVEEAVDPRDLLGLAHALRLAEARESRP